jgi:hypothetical protein
MKLTSYFSGVVEKINNKILKKNSTKYSNEYDDNHTNTNTEKKNEKNNISDNKKYLFKNEIDNEINVSNKNNDFFHKNIVKYNNSKSTDDYDIYELNNNNNSYINKNVYQSNTQENNVNTKKNDIIKEETNNYPLKNINTNAKQQYAKQEVWEKKNYNAEECEDIADEFAIGFAEWIIGGKIGEKYLEIYKKEKGL